MKSITKKGNLKLMTIGILSLAMWMPSVSFAMTCLDPAIQTGNTPDQVRAEPVGFADSDPAASFRQYAERGKRPAAMASHEAAGYGPHPRGADTSGMNEHTDCTGMMHAGMMDHQPGVALPAAGGADHE